METLIFLATVLTVIILIIKIFRRKLTHKCFSSQLKVLWIILLFYAGLWMFFNYTRKEIIVPYGTPVCFDDWCASVLQAEKKVNLGVSVPKGQYVILLIRMSNHARGISQKPSEPRIHIVDESHSWSVSPEGQEALEKVAGKHFPLDQKLGLGQDLETQFVFDIPKNLSHPKIIIEEGPFITRFLFPTDQEVFELQ